MIEFMPKLSTSMVRPAASSMPKCLVQALRQAAVKKKKKIKNNLPPEKTPFGW